MKTATKPRRRTVTAAAPPEPEASPADTPPGDQPPASDTAMVCFMLPSEIASKLAVDGGLPPEKLHITLIYLGPDATTALDRSAVEEAIRSALAGTDTEEDEESGPTEDTDTISGIFNGVARFTATEDPDGNGVPIVLTLDAPGLADFREDLAEGLHGLLDFPSDTHGFVPHCTVQYVEGLETDPISLPPPPMVEVTFDSVTLAWGDPSVAENLTTFPLAGPADTEADTTPPDESGPPVPPPLPTMQTAEESVAPVAEPDEGRTIPVAGPLGMFEACLVTEGIPTDEVFPVDESGESVVMGRLIPEGILTWRTPPLPGGFAVNEVGSPADNGHMGAPIACAATEIVREGNRIMARGPYLDNADGMALKQAVDGGAPIGPSIDLGASDQWEITTDPDGTSRRTLLEGSIAGFVVLPYEAQHSTEDGTWLTWFRSIPNSEAEPAPMEPMPEGVPVPDGVPVAASASLTACGEGLFGAPLYPPRDWFETPSPGEFVGPTITDEGQIFGHAAGKTCHIGIPGTCLRISDGILDHDFRVFHKGLDGKNRGIKTAEGELIQVGQVTLAGGHADTRLGAADARRHYDDTNSVIGNVRIVWDPVVGSPWMAGAIQHTATEGQIQQMRAAGEVSVDYRELEDGRLHLIALPVVPRGGFPPLRALSAGGEIRTLILTAGGEDMAVIGAADLPIAPRDTLWDAGGATQRVQKLCKSEAGELDPACFGRAFFWRDDSEPDTNVGSYSLPFADIVNGKLQAVYAGVSAGAGRLNQADIPAADKERIRGKMAAYYARFAKAFDDPTIKPPWESKSETVASSAFLLDLAKHVYGQELATEESLLASAHQREMQRLTEGVW